jgi:hypothetical protein
LGGTYTLEYALDSTFASGLVTMSGLAETTYTTAGTLSDDTYYWHVEAADSATNTSGFQSHPFGFILDTQAPETPVLIAPPDSSVTDQCRPQFVWSRTAGDGGSYMLQYALDAAFTHGICIVHDIPGTTFTVAYPFPHLVDTTYYWHVEACDVSDNRSGFQGVPHLFMVGAAGVDDPILPVPPAFVLSGNFPNPFRSVTWIRYALPRDCHVRLSVYNVLGQRVVTLVDEVQPAGYMTAQWDGRNESGHTIASGIYFCSIEAGRSKSVRKMVLMK